MKKETTKELLKWFDKELDKLKERELKRFGIRLNKELNKVEKEFYKKLEKTK